MIVRATLFPVILCVAFVSGPAVCSAQEGQNDMNPPALEKSSKEHLTMEGVEIQGTVEKPHAVYVIPWGDIQDRGSESPPLTRSFREEIIKPVDREEFYHSDDKRSISAKGGTK